MTAVAMPLDKLDVWLQGRAHQGAAATNLSMLDGFVTAVVAGPVSMDPPEWICPLLGIEIDAFNHGGTPEFAAISAVAVRHNAIVETLSKAPQTFEPIFARKPNHDINAGPWCEGFYAAMKLRLSAWAPLRNLTDINYGLLLPIRRAFDSLRTCVRQCFTRALLRRSPSRSRVGCRAIFSSLVILPRWITLPSAI